MWREIDQSPNVTLDRLSLGFEGQHWGLTILVDGSEMPFADTYATFSSHFYGNTKRVLSYDKVKFVALGQLGDWAFNVDGKVYYSGPESFKKAMRRAKSAGREVVASKHLFSS